MNRSRTVDRLRQLVLLQDLRKTAEEHGRTAAAQNCDLALRRFDASCNEAGEVAGRMTALLQGGTFDAGTYTTFGALHAALSDEVRARAREHEEAGEELAAANARYHRADACADMLAAELSSQSRSLRRKQAEVAEQELLDRFGLRSKEQQP